MICELIYYVLEYVIVPDYVVINILSVYFMNMLRFIMW